MEAVAVWLCMVRRGEWKTWSAARDVRALGLSVLSSAAATHSGGESTVRSLVGRLTEADLDRLLGSLPRLKAMERPELPPETAFGRLAPSWDNPMSARAGPRNR